MTLIEFIGFILTMFLLILLSSRSAAERKKREADPNFYGKDEEEEGEEEEEEDGEEGYFAEGKHTKISRLLPRLTAEEAELLERELRFAQSIQERHHTPPRPPKAIQRQKKRPIEKQQLVAAREQPHQKLFVTATVQRPQLEAELDPYSLIKKGKSTRLEKIFRKLGSKREMMILHEVLKKPKALRDDEYDS